MDIAKHPLLTRRYILPTPQLNLLLTTIVDWVMLCKPGGMIYGRYRVGKTWASIYLKAELPEQFPGLPIFYVPERATPGKSEKDFFSHFLASCDFALDSKSGTGGAFRNRLSDYLTQCVTNSKQPRLVLLLDEAQRMTDIQFQWVVDVFNELINRQVRPTFILLGQPQLLNKRASLQIGEQRQIVARFMSNEFELKGLAYAAFSEVLAVYDDGNKLCFPEGSGISFTEYFTPKRYEGGWRIKSIAESLTAAFQKLLNEKKLPKVTAIPMEYFAGTIAALLFDLHKDDSDLTIMSEERFNKAIENSGFLNYVAHTSKPEPEEKSE